MRKLTFIVLAVTLGLAGAPYVHAVNLDGYSISSYDVEMTLGRDSEGRSVLKTVESITAQFPDFDQNRGLEKVFVKTYNGHSLSLNVEGVTDQNGVSRQYHWTNDAL